MKKTILAVFALSALVVAVAFTSARGGMRLSDAGSEEANITRVTARLLENSQFFRHRLDDEMASRFLDLYLDSLDGEHMLFLQSDVERFDAFRPKLAQLTRERGDTSLAHAIFAVYLERLGQRLHYSTNLLRTASFDFTGQDQYTLDRKNAPRPANLAEAQQLWRQRLRYDFLQQELAGKKPEEIVRVLSGRYTRFEQTMARMDRGAVLELYLNALAQVYDPHSDYLGQEEAQNLSMEMNLSLAGIGATLQSENGYCKIQDLIAGGPAARSGLLKPGDRIVAVAQAGKDPVDLVDLPLPQAVELIRGPKGTTVRLTVIPAGADDSVRRAVSLVRAEIKLKDQRASARVIDLPQSGGGTRRLGVIVLPAFYGGMDDSPGGQRESATHDVAQLLGKLKQQHVQGIILDLRHNGGGSLEEAITLTGLFIRKGPVVQTRAPDGSVDLGADTDGKVAYDGPLVVLMSRFSASASEILTGALKDYKRALVVGDSSTFGKGTVQQVIPLAPIFDRNDFSYSTDPGALKVTIRKFYRPDGASTQLHGVKADIVLPSLTDESDIAEAAMQNPLPWDSVPAAHYNPVNRVQPYLQTLRARSAARISKDPGFSWLRDDQAELKTNLETRTVSLNEKERREEMRQAKARAEARKRERLAIREQSPPAYEITVGDTASSAARAASSSTSKTVGPQVAASGAQPAGASDAAFAESIDLREAENILADYIDLLAPPTVVTRR